MSGKKANGAQPEKNNSTGSTAQDESSAEMKAQEQGAETPSAYEQEQAAVEQEEEEKITESVDELKALVNAEKDRYLRLMAEFDNYKKRISRDYDRLVESANEKLILDLIDVRENFDRAIQSAQNNTDYQGLLDGLKLIFSKFESVLEKNGLEVFAVSGDEFDPQIHDALMKAAHPEIPEGHISEVYEKGYKLKGRVIKHAKVIVSSGLQS
jgi:molecular chaperone GrpE